MTHFIVNHYHFGGISTAFVSLLTYILVVRPLDNNSAGANQRKVMTFKDIALKWSCASPPLGSFFWIFFSIALWRSVIMPHCWVSAVVMAGATSKY